MEYIDKLVAEIARLYHIFRLTYRDYDPQIFMSGFGGEIAKNSMRILYTSSQELKSRTTPRLRKLLGISDNDLGNIEGLCEFFLDDDLNQGEVNNARGTPQ